MNFDAMNDIVSKMLLNLTSSMRFEGSLNVDINEIAMNLVPFPRLKYILSSLSPLFHHLDVKMQYSGIEAVFLDAFKKENLLVSATPSTFIACGVLTRGNLSLSDIQRNIKKYHSLV
jgi:tubulin epsilon